MKIEAKWVLRVLKVEAKWVLKVLKEGDNYRSRSSVAVQILLD